MKLSRSIGLAIVLSVLTVFNTLFFTLKPAYTMPSVWINYGFIQLACIILLGATFYQVEAPAGDRTSNAAICFWYMVYVIVVSSALICLASSLLWLTLILQLIPAGILAIILFSTLSIHRRTAEKTVASGNEVDFIRDMILKLQSIADRLEDEKTKKSVENLLDVVRSSPTKSDNRVLCIEQKLQAEITAASEAMNTGNDPEIPRKIKELGKLINERNNMLLRMN